MYIVTISSQLKIALSMHTLSKALHINTTQHSVYYPRKE